MATQEIFHRARLIPVSGIGSTQEAEERATSALLAVLSVVRDFSKALLSPLGASRAEKATVDTYSEVVMNLDRRRIRPDGLIRVTYGKSTWSCLVEVKTGTNKLDADQINAYWDLARNSGIDHILTVSNEIPPQPGVHPTPGLKVRSNSRVGVSHYSWSEIVTTAIKIREHSGVDDVEQAWILGELIRYLQHPKSGALEFDDMGPHWVAIRDAARAGDLTKRSEGIEDICERWDQLLSFVAMRLASDIGEDVTPVLPRNQRDPRQRRASVVNSLVTTGLLNGSLKVPNTAGNIDVQADLRAQQLTASIDVGAPEDRGSRARITWLLRQLNDAPGEIVVEAYPKAARTPTTATLDRLRDDRDAGLNEQRQEPARFRVLMRRPMGMSRSVGRKSQGFITSVLDLVDEFYGSVVQRITPWQRPAPQLKRQAPAQRDLERATESDDSAWVETNGGPTAPSETEASASDDDQRPVDLPTSADGGGPGRT